MVELTRYEMEGLLLEHEKAELELDLDATMATLCPDPHFEIVFLDLQVGGWDAVKEMYRRMLKGGGEARNLQAVARIIADDTNALVREARISWDTDDGNRVTGLYSVTIAYDPETGKILGERMYGDPNYSAMMAKVLGEDFADIPGVTVISENAPVIYVHDAYQLAERRGVVIQRPEKSNL